MRKNNVLMPAVAAVLAVALYMNLKMPMHDKPVITYEPVTVTPETEKETKDEIPENVKTEKEPEEAVTSVAESAVYTAEQETVPILTDTVSIPSYEGNMYELVNNNVPDFTDEEFKKAETSYEFYSELDDLGRCGMCEASVGTDIMPTEKRGDIGSVKPSGWKQAKYRGVTDDGAYDPTVTQYLYNRCHILAYELTAENANPKNLITGTRMCNIAMTTFENKTANYVKDTGNNVLYRVTPVFEGNELVARGLHMEGASVYDKGASLSFNVFIFNIQPGFTINYLDGSSSSDYGDPDLYGGKS